MEEEEDQPRVWVLYGWFSGLMCVGSVFGAVTWGAYMQNLAALFSSATLGLSQAQILLLYAQTQYWSAAFDVTYAIEFMCLIVAKLMVLHRMGEFLIGKHNSMGRRLFIGWRVVMSSVVVFNVAGLCGNAAAAVFAKQSGDLCVSAAASYAANNSDAGTTFHLQANKKSSTAYASCGVTVSWGCRC